MMEIAVTDCGAGRYEIRARKAVVHVDVLPDAGGADDGFRSVELLLAGLGACTAGTLRTYAVNHEVKGFEGVDVTVRSEEAAAPERVGKIEVTLHLRGDVSDEDAERLLQVSNHCKVHSTLRHLPELSTKVTRPSA